MFSNYRLKYWGWYFSSEIFSIKFMFLIDRSRVKSIRNFIRKRMYSSHAQTISQSLSWFNLLGIYKEILEKYERKNKIKISMVDYNYNDDIFITYFVPFQYK
jgi:hypothetical protein